MKDKITLKYSLELLAALATIGGIVATLYTFIPGKHYIIPTIILIFTILFFNLAYYGYQNQLWAKRFLFWIVALLACHSFFALFMAKAPREVLGDAFLPIYGTICIVTGFLSVQYARINQLFKSLKSETAGSSQA